MQPLRHQPRACLASLSEASTGVVGGAAGAGGGGAGRAGGGHKRRVATPLHRPNYWCVLGMLHWRRLQRIKRGA